MSLCHTLIHFHLHLHVLSNNYTQRYTYTRVRDITLPKHSNSDSNSISNFFFSSSPLFLIASIIVSLTYSQRKALATEVTRLLKSITDSPLNREQYAQRYVHGTLSYLITSYVRNFNLHDSPHS